MGVDGSVEQGVKRAERKQASAGEVREHELEVRAQKKGMQGAGGGEADPKAEVKCPPGRVAGGRPIGRSLSVGEKWPECAFGAL
jgi:hypothetical protein